MTQLQLDLAEGQRRKREGISKAASHEPTFTEIMQAIAIKRSIEFGEVDTDYLRQYAEDHGIRPANCNSWGAILRGAQWETLRFQQSAWVSNHARIIRVVRYRGNQ